MLTFLSLFLGFFLLKKFDLTPRKHFTKIDYLVNSFNSFMNKADYWIESCYFIYYQLTSPHFVLLNAHI
jgi:hypothetical protein